jgi:hypothetical protein
LCSICCLGLVSNLSNKEYFEKEEEPEMVESPNVIDESQGIFQHTIVDASPPHSIKSHESTHNSIEHTRNTERGG